MDGELNRQQYPDHIVLIIELQGEFDSGGKIGIAQTVSIKKSQDGRDIHANEMIIAAMVGFIDTLRDSDAGEELGGIPGGNG